MTRHRLSWLLVVLVAATLPLLAGTEAEFGSSIVAPDREIGPIYHDADRDGPIYMTRDLSGGLWAVWAFHNGLNVEVAVSRAVGFTWSNPTLLGEANGAADLDPRLEFLADGTGVLVWWQRPDDGASSNRVMFSRLVGSEWTDPAQLSPEGVAASRPSIFLSESGTAAVGYVVTSLGGPSRVEITELGTLLSTPPNDTGGSNGPDPIPTVTRRTWEDDTWWWPDPIIP